MPINPDNDATPSQPHEFTPAINPTDLLPEPTGPSLDQYSVSWLPGQEEHMQRVTRAIQRDPGKSKTETLTDALAEQRREGITFTGFENDPHFENLEAQLAEVFSQDLLDTCLVDVDDGS
jgi:hypothetical protein